MLQTVLCGAACAAAAYLLGSLSFSIIVTRLLYHKDIRTFGSGNAGMTNVLRTYGPKYAALTFVGDFLKGVAAVFLGRFIFSFLTSAPPVIGAYIAGMAVVLGGIVVYMHRGNIKRLLNGTESKLGIKKKEK